MRLFYFAFVVLIFSPIQSFASEEAYVKQCLKVHYPHTTDDFLKAHDHLSYFCQCFYREVTEAPLHKSDIEKTYKRKREKTVANIEHFNEALSSDPNVSDGLVSQICNIRESHVMHVKAVHTQEFKKHAEAHNLRESATLDNLTKKERLTFSRSLSREIVNDFTERGRDVQKKIHELLHQDKVSTPSYRMLYDRAQPCKSQLELKKIEEDFAEKIAPLSPESLAAKAPELLETFGRGSGEQHLISRRCSHAIRAKKFP